MILTTVMYFILMCIVMMPERIVTMLTTFALLPARVQNLVTTLLVRYGFILLDIDLTSVLTPISKAIIAGGMLLLIWGGVKAAIALPQHNGPDVANGFLGAVGGAAIMVLGKLLTSVKV